MEAAFFEKGHILEHPNLGAVTPPQLHLKVRESLLAQKVCDITFTLVRNRVRIKVAQREHLFARVVPEDVREGIVAVDQASFHPAEENAGQITVEQVAVTLF